jgi:hypothetical protein
VEDLSYDESGKWIGEPVTPDEMAKWRMQGYWARYGIVF